MTGLTALIAWIETSRARVFLSFTFWRDLIVWLFFIGVVAFGLEAIGPEIKAAGDAVKELIR